jgi:hypothetical protein
VSACPRCGKELADDAAVCRHCLHILDRGRWQHDAGRLGADGRGRGQPLEDPPVGPIPVTTGGMHGGGLGSAGAVANSVSRLVTLRLLFRRRKR